MKCQLTPLALLITLLGCTDPLEDVFGNAETISIVRDADTVQAYRVPSQYGDTGPVDIDLLDDESMLTGPVPVPDNRSTELKELLLDQSTYGWDYAKSCEPNYGVRVQFKSNGDHVDVLFCFQCEILAVYRDGKVVGGEDFDNAHHQLVSIVKQLFPNDELIQSLD